LRGWQLGTSGFITPYYMAGVRSMAVSWHNFFFNSFDPTGFVSLDKPPLAFWAQALTVKIFGFSPLTVLLPQLLEGLLSILVLYHLVRRVFGAASGLLAALFLALTPIAVAVDRSNNTDTPLVLTLLLAAWTFSRAVETGRMRWLMLSAGLVGIGFNVKMLVAFGLVPTFCLLYIVGAQTPLSRRIGHVAAAAVVLAAVSLSWATVYELTPPENRPFVDGTRNNSMLELVVGHNGIQRFVRRARNLPGAPSVDAESSPGAVDRPVGTSAGSPPSRDYAPAGALRLAAPHLAAQIGWLLPLALIGGTAAWLRVHPLAGLGRERLSLALWAGWALSYGIVFSAAGGLFHAYYLVAMAPAISALAGIGWVGLWSLYLAGGPTALLLPGALPATALWQAHIVDGYLTGYLAVGREWLLPAPIGATAVAAFALAALRRPRRGLALALGGVTLSMLLAMPMTWSAGTVLAAGNTGFPAARPPFLSDAAETQRRRWALVAGALDGVPKLIAFLQQNRHGEEYLLAAVNARQAAPIIVATGDPVMALGGFSGRDPIVTIDRFVRMVEGKFIRFALVGDGSAGLRRIFGEDGQKPLVDWIRENGRRVDRALWRSAAPGFNSGFFAAEAVGAELYDLRPSEDAR
jgi:4-amino-4-deoxy-L-arabinose transferase-like glycosyltransferase